MANLKQLIVVMVITLGVISCKKEYKTDSFLERNISSSYLLSNGVQSMVQYNTQYGVLVFNSLDDVYKLNNFLRDQNPFDRGNSTQINQMLNDVLNNGFTNNGQGSTNQVKLQNLQILLENSHPLSETSLTKLIQVHNQVNFPVSFLKLILISNTPFSYEIREKVGLITNIPQVEKQAILDEDEDDLDKMDYVYEDFLKLFPSYKSVYEKQMNQEINALQSGMSPSSNLFNHDVFSSDFEQLIRNEKFEVYINNEGLLKAYKNCMEILFPLPIADAYSELQLISPNGNITIPTVSEGPQGISMNTINQNIPSEFITFNPEEYDPLIDESTDPYYNTALQELNIIETCPISNYTVSFDTSTFLTATFSNSTFYPSVPSPPVTHQYWTFGDGTGSFQTNPVHAYSTAGVYTVTLTTFSTDCGCFHQHTTTIYAGPIQTRAGNPDCEIFLNFSVLKDHPAIGENQFRLDIDGAGAFGTIYYDIVKFNLDGSLSSPLLSGTGIQGINYIDIPASFAEGVYKAKVYTTRVDGCPSSAETEAIWFSIAGEESSSCCSRKEYVEYYEEVTVGSNQYWIGYRDIARGRFYKTVSGYIKPYKKNKKGKYKKIKADHSVEIVGDVYELSGKDECTETTLDIGHISSEKTKKFTFESFLVWEYKRPKFGIKTPINFHHYIDYGPDKVWNDKIFTLICNP